MILFARMDGECVLEQKAGYLSQLESLEFYSKTFTLEPQGLPLLITEDLERCWLMKPEGDWCRLDGGVRGGGMRGQRLDLWFWFGYI